MSAGGLVQSINRSLDVVEALCRSERAMGVAELARQLNLAKTTVYRILKTLESRHYVRQDRSTGNYAAGHKILELASLVQSRLHLQPVSYTHLTLPTN